MSCCCCTSSRGASFFCTSIHLFIGLYWSVKWVIVTYVNGLNNEYFEDERMRIIYPLLLIYLSIFLVLGCINFIAVERESPGILKWSMRVFILLQISMLLINTLLAFAFPENDNDLAVHRFYHIKYMILNIVATSIYYYVIWKFTFSLEHGIYEVHKKRRKMKHPPMVSDTVRQSGAGPSAPWSESPSVTSRLHREDLEHDPEPDYQTLPLKEDVPSEPDYQTLPLKEDVPKVSEPQPCSSKDQMS